MQRPQPKREDRSVWLRLGCSSCPGWQIDASFQLITGEWLAKGLWVCVLVCFDVLPEPGIAGWGLGSFTHSLADLLFCPSLLLHTIYIPDDNGYSFPMANCWSGNGKVKSIFRRGNRLQVPHWLGNKIKRKWLIRLCPSADPLVLCWLSQQ